MRTIAAALRTGRSAAWRRPPTVAEAPKFGARDYHGSIVARRGPVSCRASLVDALALNAAYLRPNEQPAGGDDSGDHDEADKRTVLDGPERKQDRCRCAHAYDKGEGPGDRCALEDRSAGTAQGKWQQAKPNRLRSRKNLTARGT